MSMHRTHLTYGAVEGASATLTATLKDGQGNVVPGDQLMALLLTLYEANSRKIINGRDNQDVLGNDNTVATHGVTVDNNGVLTWEMHPDDNAIIHPGKTGTAETHIALFEWGWGNKTGKHEIVIPVENLELD